MEESIDQCVKNEKKREWLTAKRKWFVINPDDAAEIRLPGKMKLEWETKTGSYIW